MAHYDAGQYVEMWGDQGHRLGFCLYKVGCKGPVTYQNCPNVRWNEGTNWPIGCGHPCIGCAEPDFWDKMTPFYSHLTGIPGFGDAADIDRIGLWATAAVGGAFATHGLVQLGKREYQKRKHSGGKPPPDAAPVKGTDSAPDDGGDEASAAKGAEA